MLGETESPLRPQAVRVAAESSPCVLHGGWLPGDSDGKFVVWAEVTHGSRRSRKDDHPFHLQAAERLGALAQAWPRPGADEGFGVERIRAWTVLPGDGNAPAPSLELQADLDRDSSAATSWGCWRVDALQIADPVAMLEQLPGKDPQGIRTVRIGQDLRFWSRLLASLEDAVRRHEYLPAVFAIRSDARASRRKKSGAWDARFDAGWELADAARERIVDTYSLAMPGACRALRSRAPADASGQGVMPDARMLASHFLAVHLEALVARARMPRFVLGAFDRSFPIHALPADNPLLEPISEATWQQWRKWRDRIQRSSLDADERICFRLADAPHTSPDDWRLEWLVSSRRDPSLQVPLADFWARGTSRRPSSRSVREVLLQLGQAARLYGKLWEGMDSDAPQGLALNREEALDFLRYQAPVLQGAGFRVIVPAWWTVTGQRRLRLRLTSQGAAGGAPGTESSGLLGFDTLVDFKPQLVLDGTPLTREEWERVVAAKQGLVELRGQWMELGGDEVSRLEEFWESGDSLHRMTVGDVLRTGAGADAPEIVHDGEAGRLLAGFCGTGALEQLEQPAGFAGQLRPYQLRGYSWLSYLERLGFGACLADDMGLGKTIQVLATILEDRARQPDGGPTLLVAPTSVLGNWHREARRFAPSLATYVHHGPGRPRSAESFASAVLGADIVVVSFAGARLDVGVLSKIQWRRLVVDESQNAKNPSAAVTKALRRIRAKRRVALTGTPVENRLMDLWSLFSFINPGYLGTVTEFRKSIERPIMKDRNRVAAARLRGMVQPFILRRMKTDKAIIQDLPDKVEQNSNCNLTPEQASLYEAVVRDVEASIGEAEGINRQGLMLSTLTRLKQICNHPAQFLQDASEFSESRSHKLARVCEMLDEIEAEGESALVFTQFTEIGKSLEALFRKRYGGAVYYLHGGTPRARREHMVEEFQNPDTERAIFVLSLRAGGTGITLTRANHVIHFDRWWNPAVENQATDRAYRIGQEKRVLVHKMVTIGTLEERIDELIESKRQLAEEIVGSGESWLANLDNETFRKLIALERSDAVVG